jgi:hypothetical protein
MSSLLVAQDKKDEPCTGLKTHVLPSFYFLLSVEKYELRENVQFGRQV